MIVCAFDSNNKNINVSEPSTLHLKDLQSHKSQRRLQKTLQQFSANKTCHRFQRPQTHEKSYKTVRIKR